MNATETHFRSQIAVNASRRDLGKGRALVSSFQYCWKLLTVKYLIQNDFDCSYFSLSVTDTVEALFPLY